MACCTGETHTICLSDEGILYSFGRNKEGQLGQTEGKVSVPSQITKYYINNEVFTLPIINQISCGADFTICVDYEGFLYSFGENNRGLLGIGSTEKYFKYPQKIQDIPPVLSISCGVFHTLVITNDDNLWSFGNNEFGQLCLGNKENQVKPKQTQFSDIVKIAASYHSLFQNKNEEIYGCGETNAGQLCVNSSQPQTEVRRLEDHPSNIIQFCCGYYHSLFLDSQGNVFSIGFNHYGNLGIGNTIHQNKFCQIPNIPSIQSISCVGHSSYLIDIDGNLWSFGSNGCGQLGLGDSENRIIPTKHAESNISQVASGCCGNHFLFQNFENKIFVSGKAREGQLGIKYANTDVSVYQEMNPDYFSIWGKPQTILNRVKSARK